MEEATALLREGGATNEVGGGAIISAGCTDLVAQIREGLTPSLLISLKHTSDMADIDWRGDILEVGAMFTHFQGANHPVLREAIPALSEAWTRIANVRVRYVATLGGNLMARRYRYEMPIMLSSLSADMIFRTPLGDDRVPLDDLWTLGVPGDSLLYKVRVESASLRWFAYERSMRPTSTLATTVREVKDGLHVKCVIGSEYRRPVVLQQILDFGDLEVPRAEALAREMASRIPETVGDYGGSAGYRRHIAAIMLARQLQDLNRSWLS